MEASGAFMPPESPSQVLILLLAKISLRQHPPPAPLPRPLSLKTSFLFLFLLPPPVAAFSLDPMLCLLLYPPSCRCSAAVFHQTVASLFEIYSM